MKHFLALTALTLIGASSLPSASEDFRIEKDPTIPAQPLKLKFWGNPDVYYVIESCLDLTESWDEYFYAVKGVAGTGGSGQLEAVQFAPFPQAPKAFFRLRFDSNPFSLLGMIDHDGDGIPTAIELDNGMNATVAETFTDSDLDGLGDYWETLYFGDLSRDGTEDFDGDGTLDSEEWANRTHPTDSSWDIPYWNDKDADMLNACVESLIGSNLNSATSHESTAVEDAVSSSTGADVVLVVANQVMQVAESTTTAILSNN